MEPYSLKNADELEALIDEAGFIPFFKSAIDGFSVEEYTDPAYWFVDGVDGPWEWKNEIARRSSIAYGKFFHHKTGYISNRFIPDFCNFRRDGYDFDALYEDGKASRKSRDVYELVSSEGSLLSYEIKRRLGYRKGGLGGFEGVLSTLEMQCYLTTTDFEYRRNASGDEYGWGVARYDTFERVFGRDFVRSRYHDAPEASRERIIGQLASRFPSLPLNTLSRFITG